MENPYGRRRWHGGNGATTVFTAAGVVGAGLAGIELCFCASFLAQTKKERGATGGLIHKAAVQISLM